MGIEPSTFGSTLLISLLRFILGNTISFTVVFAPTFYLQYLIIDKHFFRYFEFELGHMDTPFSSLSNIG